MTAPAPSKTPPRDHVTFRMRMAPIRDLMAETGATKTDTLRTVLGLAMSDPALMREARKRLKAAAKAKAQA